MIAKGLERRVVTQGLLTLPALASPVTNFYQSSTGIADPRRNETSYAIATANLPTRHLRVAEANLLLLSNPLHLNYPIHHPIGVQFLLRARKTRQNDAKTPQKVR